jgi:hypothetical protein
LNLIPAEICIDIAFIENRIGIKLLLGHSHYAANSLRCEGVALNLSKYEKYSSTRAVPAEGDGLFEEENFRDVIEILNMIKICLLARKPYGQTGIGGIDAISLIQVSNNFLPNSFVIGSGGL